MTEIANQVVIAFCALLVVWYVVGWQVNRRRGERLLAWILQELRPLGDQTTVSRLGTSGFQVNVGKARAPFKVIETAILLEPREILLLWIFNRLRGGADHLIIKGSLRAAPRGEVEVVKKGGRLAGRALEGLDDEEAWTHQKIAAGLVMACRGEKGQRQAEAISHLVEGLSPRLLRLSLSKKAPHLLLNLSLAGLDERSVLLLLSSLQDLAQAIASSGH
jgi:hypothetical protein